MVLLALLLLPVLASALTFMLRALRFQLSVMLVSAALHFGLTLVLYLLPEPSALSGFLALDALGRLFLFVVSLLFLCVAIYSTKYLLDGTHDPPSAPYRYVPCVLLFLATMDLVILAQHLALMWAAIEATTLVSAPLIYFYRRKAALEATWKYLLICSVGIALALLGTFFLGIAASSGPDGTPVLLLSNLRDNAATLSRPWLKTAFVLALVGYGTKMGLAPLHTWLPDVYSQAPSPVAVLSGALTNCALLGILRFYQICASAGEAAFARELLLVLGFTSLVVAAAFLIGQRDYKRLLAYSSVENMGVIAIGFGLGENATSGALLHIINHSMCKGALFLLAGNFLRAFGSTEVEAVRGGLRLLPRTSVLTMLGLLAIGGTPPFGPFISELTIFMSAVQSGHLGLAVLFLGLLALAFLGMAGVLLPMLQGSGQSPTPPSPSVQGQPLPHGQQDAHGHGVAFAQGGAALSALPKVRSLESRWYILPPLFLLGGVVLLGVYLPPPLLAALGRALDALSGTPPSSLPMGLFGGLP